VADAEAFRGAVVGRDQVAVFVARVGFLRREVLARILEAKNTNFHFTPPKDFDAAKYYGDSIGLYVGGKPFRFKVRVAREIAPWITEVRWHPAQRRFSGVSTAATSTERSEGKRRGFHG
jgi:hypothetical protein